MASFNGLLCPVLAKIAEVDEKHAAASDRVLQAFRHAEELHPGIDHDFIHLLLQKEHSGDHRPSSVPRHPGSSGMASPTIVRTPSAPSPRLRPIPRHTNSDGLANPALSPPHPAPRPRSPSAPAPPIPPPRRASNDEGTRLPSPFSPGGASPSHTGNRTSGGNLTPIPSPRPPERPPKKSSLQDALNGSPQYDPTTSPAARTPPMRVQGGSQQQNLTVEAAQQQHNRRQSSPQTLVTPPSSSSLPTLGPIAQKLPPAPRRESAPNTPTFTKEQTQEMQRRLLDVDTQCSGLQARLAALPRDIAHRAVFLESIKDIAATIKQLLEAVSGVTEASPREWLSNDSRAVIEEHKKQFISSSRTFSSALKDHFRDPNQRQVFATSDALAGLTKQLHKAISSSLRPA